MGSASSKAGRSVARAAPKRQYPQRVPPNVTSNPPPPERATGPSVKPKAQASETRNESIDRDAADPDFARSLRSIGPVTPAHQLPNSSAFQPQNAPSDPNAPRIYPDPARNPALKVLDARRRIAAEAEEEFASLGREGAPGRQFLDVLDLRQVLKMRDGQGLGLREIEKRLELRDGLLERLGKKGVIAEPS